MKKTVLIILYLTTLYCYSQEPWSMQVWNKNGSMYQFETDNIDSVTFVKKSDFRNWEKIIKVPTITEINEINNISQCRSPYLTAWLDTGLDEGFSGYSIDFKADYLPLQTYCCLATFRFDYMNSSLCENYDRIDNGENYSCYAGFQRINKPNLPEYNGIISLWETYCYKSGKIDTLRATLVEPTGVNAISYNHEGNGVSFRPEYLWIPRKWYRMLVQFAETRNNEENTKLEYWACDLETKKWTKLCVFDMGARGVQFQRKNAKYTGKTAVFLENWLPETAGEIRSLEFKNIRIYSRPKAKWINVYSGYFADRENHGNICYSGSYQYGNDESTFWMITTGVPGCADSQNPLTLTVENSEEGSPLVIK